MVATFIIKSEAFMREISPITKAAIPHEAKVQLRYYAVAP